MSGISYPGGGGGASGSVSVTSVPTDSVLTKSITSSASGDATVHTPASGKSIRLFYLGYSADGANSADVTAYVKFGAGSAIYKQSLAAKAMFAHTVAARRYVQGAVDEALTLNLSAAQTVHVNIEYLEV